VNATDTLIQKSIYRNMDKYDENLYNVFNDLKNCVNRDGNCKAFVKAYAKRLEYSNFASICADFDNRIVPDLFSGDFDYAEKWSYVEVYNILMKAAKSVMNKTAVGERPVLNISKKRYYDFERLSDLKLFQLTDILYNYICTKLNCDMFENREFKGDSKRLYASIYIFLSNAQKIGLSEKTTQALKQSMVEKLSGRMLRVLSSARTRLRESNKDNSKLELVNARIQNIQNNNNLVRKYNEKRLKDFRYVDVKDSDTLSILEQEYLCSK